MWLMFFSAHSHTHSHLRGTGAARNAALGQPGLALPALSPLPGTPAEAPPHRRGALPSPLRDKGCACGPPSCLASLGHPLDGRGAQCCARAAGARPSGALPTAWDAHRGAPVPPGGVFLAPYGARDAPAAHRLASPPLGIPWTGAARNAALGQPGPAIPALSPPILTPAGSPFPSSRSRALQLFQSRARYPPAPSLGHCSPPPLLPPPSRSRASPSFSQRATAVAAHRPRPSAASWGPEGGAAAGQTAAHAVFGRVRSLGRPSLGRARHAMLRSGSLAAPFQRSLSRWGRPLRRLRALPRPLRGGK